jgi:hypothetical protein
MDQVEKLFDEEKVERRKIGNESRKKGGPVRIYDCFFSSWFGHCHHELTRILVIIIVVVMKMMVLIRGRNLCVGGYIPRSPSSTLYCVRSEHFPDDNQKQLSTHKLLFVLNLYPIMMVCCTLFR